MLNTSIVTVHDLTPLTILNKPACKKFMQAITAILAFSSVVFFSLALYYSISLCSHALTMTTEALHTTLASTTEFISTYTTPILSNATNTSVKATCNTTTLKIIMFSGISASSALMIITIITCLVMCLVLKHKRLAKAIFLLIFSIDITTLNCLLILSMFLCCKTYIPIVIHLCTASLALALATIASAYLIKPMRKFLYASIYKASKVRLKTWSKLLTTVSLITLLCLSAITNWLCSASIKCNPTCSIFLNLTIAALIICYIYSRTSTMSMGASTAVVPVATFNTCPRTMITLKAISLHKIIACALGLCCIICFVSLLWICIQSISTIYKIIIAICLLFIILQILMVFTTSSVNRQTEESIHLRGVYTADKEIAIEL